MHPFITSLTFILLSLTGPIVHAQHAFQAILPGVIPAFKRPIVQTPDGGFCILAQTSSGKLVTRSEPLDPQMVLVKTNAEGSVEWSRSIATRGNRNPRPVAFRATSDGGLLVVAYALPRYTGQFAKSEAPDPHQDILVFRLNAHGHPIWSRIYTWRGIMWAGDAVVLGDGSAIIVGAIQRTDTLAPQISGNNITRKRWKGLAFRIDSEGEVLWGRTLLDFPERPTFERVEEIYGESVIVREDVVTVAFQLQHDLFSYGSTLLLNINPAGALLGDGEWLTSERRELADRDGYAGRYSTLINDLTRLPDGGYVVSGITSAHLTFGCAGFLTAYDAHSNPIWNRSYIPRENSADPATFTAIPINEREFILGGRTLEVWEDESEYGFHRKFGHPTIAIADTTGTLTDARRLATSFRNGIYIGSAWYNPTGSRLRHPLFFSTDDEGLIAIDAVEDKQHPNHHALFLARLNSDLTTCGENSTESIPFDSADDAKIKRLTAKLPMKHWSSPAISEVEVSLAGIGIHSKELSDVDVQDFKLSSAFICGGSPLLGPSSPPTEDSAEAEYLNVHPNRIQKGKSVVLEFRFLSDEKPEVNLVSAGLGEMQPIGTKRITAKGLTWSEADGKGHAAIETTGLPAGVYLVQVRSGAKQLTAELEVR